MFLLLLMLWAAGASAEPVVAVDHVNVVDVRAATILADQNVIIRGERIERVDRLAVPRGAKRISGRGRYLIPGLWDMHVHLGGRLPKEFPLYLANGVIGLREMAGNRAALAALLQLRAGVESGRTIGPELVATAEGIEARKPGSREPFRVQDALDARAAVQQAREAGADFLTVGGDVPGAAYFALAEECRRLNFPFSGHVPRDVTASEVSDARQSSIEHLDGLLFACSRSESQMRDRMRLGQPVGIESIVESFDPDRAAALACRLRSNGTWVCPTLTEPRFAAEANDLSADPDRRLRYVDPGYVREWEARRAALREGETVRKLFRAYLRLTGVLWRNGVRILAGTDTPWPYCIPGFALHDELKLLVRAGLSPAAALGAATTGPAEFLGKADTLGAVAPGRLADLVLLDENPLSDIGNTEKIAAVILRGRVFPRHELDGLLNRASGWPAAGPSRP